MLGDLPDLWDLVVSDYYGEEMATSRFVQEASLEAKVAYAKRITRKPVVSVGRFTSPDTMLRQVRSGILDFIGAARPSIADPFLPAKIREGRLDDIRECIGCNVCYSYNYRGAAIRCTQNPTMGEEWRRLASGTRPRGRRQFRADRRRRSGGSRGRPHPRQAGFAVTLADAAASPAGASRWKAGCRASRSGPVCAIIVSARSKQCRGYRCTSAAR